MSKSSRVRHGRRLLAAGSAAACALTLSACTSGSDGDVVVGFYPLEFVAATIGGDVVEVQNLAQPGAEPHDMELTAKQVGAISAASLVVYQKGLQPAIDDAVANEQPEHSLDVAAVVEQLDADELGTDQVDADGHEGESAEEHAEHADEDEPPGADDHAADDGHDHAADDGHDHGGHDPHVWLDPMLMKTIAEAVKNEMTAVDPDNEQTYAANYETLAAELEALDAEFTGGLAQCARSEIVTTHTAFGYLAEAYGLEQVGILGLSAQEPSPQQLAEVEDFVTEHGVSTIFFESGVSDDYAATVADSTGAQTAVLDPLEVAPETGDYLSAMRQNLQALRTALDCA